MQSSTMLIMCYGHLNKVKATTYVPHNRQRVLKKSKS
jgi:hypothetical protein